MALSLKKGRKSDKFHGSISFKMPLQPLKIPLVERFVWMSHWYNELNAAAFEELQDVIWDVKCCMNNRRICYIEQEFKSRF